MLVSQNATKVRGDRRAQLRAAAARVRGSLDAEFRQLGADEIMVFLRGDEPARGCDRCDCGSSHPAPTEP